MSRTSDASSGSREALLPAFVGDLRQGLRLLRRQRAFAPFVVLLLGLGIGATTAVFSLVYGVLLRPLPFPDSSRLVSLTEVLPDGRTDSLSPPDYFTWTEESSALAAAAAYWSPNLTLRGEADTEKVLGATVSYGLLRVLGVSPDLGRDFTAADDAPGAPPTAILSHGLWQRRFGSDAEVLGQTITLDDQAATVIGIAPPGFDFPRPGTELWVPLGLPREREARGDLPYRSMRILNVVARLKPDASVEQAQAELGARAVATAHTYPDTHEGVGVAVESLREARTAAVRAPLVLLLAAVLALLVMTSFNVGNLLLERAEARRRELAVRLSLGASPGRLARQLLAEGLLLAMLAGGVGLAFAFGGLQLLLAWGPQDLPRLGEVRIDGGVLAFALAATLGSGLLFSLVPALRSRRARLADAIHATRSDGGRSGRVRSLLAAAQVSLALLLLITATLLGRSFLHLTDLEVGFESQNVSFTRLELGFAQYRDAERRQAFFAELEQKAARLPGVSSAALTLGMPLDPKAEFFVARSNFELEGIALPPGPRPEVGLQVVSADFFSTLGVPVLEGRAFGAQDDSQASAVAVVNRAFAQRYLDGRPALGQTLHHDLTLVPGDPDTRRIVGVVDDFRYYQLTAQPEPQIFVPHSQSLWPQMHLVLAGPSNPAALTPYLREIVRALDPALPVPPLQRVAEVTRGAVAAPRFRASLVGLFAFVALALAALGLYAVVAYAVVRRRREIGLRMALGARQSQVLSLVLRRALGLAGLGILLGLGLSLAASRLLTGMLYGVEALDPATFLLVPALLVSVALLAAYLPALRASRIDPLEALREE